MGANVMVELDQTDNNLWSWKPEMNTASHMDETDPDGGLRQN
jgi:hypothetical protein